MAQDSVEKSTRNFSKITAHNLNSWDFIKKKFLGYEPIFKPNAGGIFDWISVEKSNVTHLFNNKFRLTCTPSFLVCTDHSFCYFVMSRAHNQNFSLKFE
jgi:hypothetical protein